MAQIYGPTAVNIHALLDTLRQQGELFLIGAEASVLEARAESRCASVNDFIWPDVDVCAQKMSGSVLIAQRRKWRQDAAVSQATCAPGRNTPAGARALCSAPSNCSFRVRLFCM